MPPALWESHKEQALVIAVSYPATDLASHELRCELRSHLSSSAPGWFQHVFRHHLPDFRGLNLGITRVEFSPALLPLSPHQRYIGARGRQIGMRPAPWANFFEIFDSPSAATLAAFRDFLD